MYNFQYVKMNNKKINIDKYIIQYYNEIIKY